MKFDIKKTYLFNTFIHLIFHCRDSSVTRSYQHPYSSDRYGANLYQRLCRYQFLKDAGIPITQNSKLKLLKSGRAKFIDLFEEIRHAKHHIHLEYFNFRNDSIANALFDLLGEKVKEGVEVRALFDAFGNLSNNKPLKKKHIQAIRDKGSKLSSSTLSNSPISIMPCTETIARL
mgnify:CR=1 FL=1